MASCPACEYDEIDTEEYEEDDKMSCPECGKKLIVVGPDELEAADAEDDVDDDDEDDDDEDEEDDDDDDEDDDDEEEKEDVDE